MARPRANAWIYHWDAAAMADRAIAEVDRADISADARGRYMRILCAAAPAAERLESLRTVLEYDAAAARDRRSREYVAAVADWMRLCGHVTARP